MEFVFCDKSRIEMDIITDVLVEENIPYKIVTKIIKDYFFDNEDEDEEDFMIIEELYDIHCFTNFEHFEFVKHVGDKRIKQRIHLERSFLKKGSKKSVQRVHKKNTTNTNNKNRNKSKE